MIALLDLTTLDYCVGAMILGFLALIMWLGSRRDKDL